MLGVRRFQRVAIVAQRVFNGTNGRIGQLQVDQFIQTHALDRQCFQLFENSSQALIVYEVPGCMDNLSRGVQSFLDRPGR